MKLSHTPRTLIIYGAGVIGSEYASIFSGLGVKVDLVDNQSRLLSFLDAEISDSLSYHLRNNAVKFVITKSMTVLKPMIAALYLR